MTPYDIDDPAVQDVLDAFLAAGDPGHASLTRWTARYPQYARDLAEFAASWSLMRWLPADERAQAGEAALLGRGMGIVQGLLAARPGAAAPPISSLLEAGREQGLAAAALAERSGLSLPLVLKLDRRLLRFATIPAQIVERVAGAVGRDAAAVASYLQGPPRLAQGASYHAPASPALAAQEDFFEAVRADLTLSPADRARLLDLPRPPSGDV